MDIMVRISKEKKEKDFRMVILPSGENKIGLGQYKDYGIISYLNKKDSKKIFAKVHIFSFLLNLRHKKT